MNLIALITSGAAIIGTVIVAIANFFFTRRINSEGKLSDRTALAYSDYLGAVAMIATHQVYDPDVIEKANHQIAAAKCRIAIYGDLEVIREIAVFARLGDMLRTREQQDAFVNIVQAMRHDNGTKGHAPNRDIGAILLGGTYQD